MKDYLDKLKEIQDRKKILESEELSVASDRKLLKDVITKCIYSVACVDSDAWDACIKDFFKFHGVNDVNGYLIANALVSAGFLRRSYGSLYLTEKGKTCRYSECSDCKIRFDCFTE